MRKHEPTLDDATADRLVAGALAPADAPPGYQGVVRLLTDARGHLPITEAPERLLGDLVLAIDLQPTTADRKRPMLTTLLTAKVGALAATALLSTAGVAAAATGNLPGPAQDAVAGVADRLGLELPTTEDEGRDGVTAGSGDEADPADETDETDARPEGTTGHADNPTDADEHGAGVSEVARTTEATGRDKGAAVSDAARGSHGPDSTDADADDADGDDEADERGRPSDAGDRAPVDTPNAGGTGTAGSASGGASDVGTSRAPDQARLGSGNAGTTPVAGRP